MTELLRLERIHFKYETKYPALIDVSATIHRGERIAVLGSNGAGKSTFFLCCNGVLKPQSGSMYLKGREITKSKEDLTELRQSVGLVFQEPDSQIIAGTVMSEVSFGPMNLGLPREEVIGRINRSLTQMNLLGYEDRAPQYLSGGEKKRVSIADILAMEPDMILLDEPTASLDPENVEILRQTLDTLSGAGITLVVSTHDVDFAYCFSTRAIVFCKGEIIADGDIDDIFAMDDVLNAAGLKKPLVYAAAELLQTRFPDAARERAPRNIEELGELIGRL